MISLQRTRDRGLYPDIVRGPWTDGARGGPSVCIVAMGRRETDLLRGTLDLLILRTLAGLEQKGWIESEWRPTEQNRPARYYTLTAPGRRALLAETKSWRRYVRAVDLILEGA